MKFDLESQYEKKGQIMGRTLLREFSLELDEVVGQERFRRTHILSLIHFLDHNGRNAWTVRLKSGGLGLNWDGSEANARRDFGRELNKLRLKERSAKASGRYAEGKFTVDSQSDDA